MRNTSVLGDFLLTVCTPEVDAIIMIHGKYDRADW